MKLVTFQRRAGDDTSPRLGALTAHEEVVDLQAAMILLRGESSPFFSTMIIFFSGGRRACDLAQELLEKAASEKPGGAVAPKEAVSLLAPVPRPASLRDCMLFERHVAQCMRTVVKHRLRGGFVAKGVTALDRRLAGRNGQGLLRAPRVLRKRPIYYKGNPYSVVGPEAAVIWPPFSKQLDYELEVGVFIGRGGRDIPPHKAAEHIAGYTIFNDFSARDVQLEEIAGRLGPSKSKDFDTGNVLGPYLATPDEIPDPRQLAMRAKINGEVWSDCSSEEMLFSFEETISYISQSETLQVGDFIGSGTPPGGCGWELDRWLAPGDVVELQIDRLGTLRNQVVAQSVRGTESNSKQSLYN